jgi:uncharacterized protein (DUF697 family)
VTTASRDDVARAIRAASIAAAGISGVRSPVPLADELALVPVYAWLTVRVARARGKTTQEVPWSPLAKTAFVGLLVRGGIDVTVAPIPGVAAVINASTAVALTVIYGACVDHVCDAASATKTLGWRDVLAALRARATRRSTTTSERARPETRCPDHGHESELSTASGM